MFLLLVMLFGCVATSCVCLDILQLFGHRLRPNAEKITDYSHPHGAEELIRGFGYTAESHRVITEDGYILTLHRLPAGKDQKRSKQKRPVVLLFHGMFCASECFLFRGPKLDLPYILVDAGYDMWLMNARGNYNSKGHIKLNPKADRDYWQFSLHEIALFDLSAAIDYILEKTRRRDLYYIGYSLSCVVGFVLCAEKPQYNSKIRLFISMAPSMFALGKRRPLFDLVLGGLPIIAEILDAANIVEIFPFRPAIADLMTAFCADGSPVQPICTSVIFAFVGENYSQLNTSIVPEALKYFPSGTSLLTVTHLHQLLTTNHFRPISLGVQGNFLKYGRALPLDYDIQNVTTPTVIYYGNGDFLVTKEDCEALQKKLPNFIRLFEVPSENFNHMDFMWGSSTEDVLYDQMILLMNKYR